MAGEPFVQLSTLLGYTLPPGHNDIWIELISQLPSCKIVMKLISLDSIITHGAKLRELERK